MIIGKGDIATVLTDSEDITWFASGVSNSKEKDTRKFARELQLLMNQPKDKHLVYFSSLCTYWSKTEYARHKRIMEDTIKRHWQSYTIVRLGNIDWGINPHTLINHFKSHPDAITQPVYRHVVSLEEFKYWMQFIHINTKNEMNIPGKMWFVPDLKKYINEKISE